MDIFSVLTMVWGLSLFLFGMSVMGEALERRAGSSLRSLLGKMTGSKLAGLLTGMGITAIIQSSSATTVMVVGFVNSGIMSLRQAINVIMGANVGTTVTAWILSLSGIDSGNIFVRLLKPSSFTPVLALVGIIYYMFIKDSKKKDTGMVLLGFATLMFGMDTMSGAVSGLKDVPAFTSLFVLFQEPVLGVLAGAVLTAIIQSSSASVGILQALAITGQISYGAAIPIIMGQNVGTCVTALLSSVGTTKNARRAAAVHLSFNVIGTMICLVLFYAVRALFSPVLLSQPADMLGIAVSHSVFNVLCTGMLLPMSGLLEKLVTRLIPEDEKKEEFVMLDQRLMATPPLALERCHNVAYDMAVCAFDAIRNALEALNGYNKELAETVRKGEGAADRYEDALGTYLVELSTKRISGSDSVEAAKLLKLIGDFERVSDHAVNIVESAEELAEKEISFSEDARAELSVLVAAIREIMDLAQNAFLHNDIEKALQVEPLEQVVDELKDQMRNGHILRMQQGKCSIAAGFVWSDLLTNLERVSDHCSNIAGSVIEAGSADMNYHELLSKKRSDSPEFARGYAMYSRKYALPGRS